MKDTSADAALADIAGIIGATVTDVQTIYCIVKVAVADLKAVRANTGGTAPAATQVRALVAAVYPSDPIAHGIALGEDVLALKKP